MGYISSVDGEIVFSRSLTGKEARDYLDVVQKTLDDPWNERVLTLAIDEETRETDEGTLAIKIISGISTEDAESGKLYELERILRELIAPLPADIQVAGYLQRDGKETGDMERLYVVGRNVVSVKPTVTWTAPEGAGF